MVEYKIGEKFDYNGIKLIVIESSQPCKDCYFSYNRQCVIDDSMGFCNKTLRKDGKCVIFKKVK